MQVSQDSKKYAKEEEIMSNGFFPRRRRVARPTHRAMALATSPRGRALAAGIGRGYMISSAVKRYGKGKAGGSALSWSVTHRAVAGLLRAKKQLESVWLRKK